MSTALIILAAGQGTRMNSDLPKVMHPIAGLPLLIHAIQAGRSIEPDMTIVVAGHDADLVEESLGDLTRKLHLVRQMDQLGTAHAVAQALPVVKAHRGDSIVLYGDTPFIKPETLLRMKEARSRFDLVVLGFKTANPGRYGRLVTVGDELKSIVEYKDANESEKAITFCNSGVVAAASSVLSDLVGSVDNKNASGEYYLTDIVEIAISRGLSATAIACDESETMGINTREELAAAETAFQNGMRSRMLANGVSMTAPETVHFSHDTVVGRDAVIEQFVVFGPGVTVETGARIRAFSHVEEAHISCGAVVGPYARIRPGTELAEDVRIGNFVEVKNALVGKGAKVNHLSYIGDAGIGEKTNIGAGTITCNFDGVMKHRTSIGKNAFIGSNTMIVSPVSIGDEAMTASGSVIVRDVPEGAIAIARSEQMNRSGLAGKFLNVLKSRKKN
ncbi:MAG: bifunctional UDP-N-acetylglucosamine diphosphorylase/glucosamine-1-phosphate N-acetyltransferase GlmU [Roseovarius sp.]|nr:bifunctional UDP-N-acetylglucosamine diphosphorylase/glucosamine-1-phosphate N-acetyltransferase GlmU [Roseovarius sp.]MCY4207320.1 bifunctional UDP-N-acetylglucosamine diphosphorylase/glucosamine-1-phosphate N-acetyltransferase GlmU [Roseovarius sp.]MCY4291560.1 bifunctional UDP-N-acetylglucosamine diphosphorylase/glucosamine-1-phosphate N-acetyltransferase GlmU [Roseovarius sp.]MCY4315570.1 bifunctional UDP-N-acetylglucosamine diphosphorylase/glucosamine-1-phosphate N-acetyltransferase GlmU